VAAAPYVLARTLKEAHEFARDELGLSRGYYRIVNTPSTLKSVWMVDLHLVPGWENRFDRFAMKGAIRWTRMNVIDHPDYVVGGAVKDDLEPAGVQQTLMDATDFVSAAPEVQNGDAMVSEGGPVTETEDGRKRRRSRCKTCQTLHFSDEPCPSEVIPGV
jgi:hypothetical protein